MSGELFLPGSLPCETAEQAFKTFGGALGQWLDYMPDGEIGTRRYWIDGVAFRVFNGHPDIETVKYPERENGVEQWWPRGRHDEFGFRVRPGVAKVQFGDPGWRLGYARDAINSYFVFSVMKERGLLPPHLRFQVSIPMVNSAAPPRIFESMSDCEKVREGYALALEAELKKILEHIPHRDLAIQWDCATELQEAYKGALDAQIPQVRVSKIIPKDVALGFHLCFGTLGGWPRFAPDDLGGAVQLANAFVAEAGRKVDWMHIPVLDRSDDAFFSPLSSLKAGDTKIYLGMVHNMDGFQNRLATARRYFKDFGVGAFCGFGRMAAAEMPRVLEEHLQAAKALESQP